MIGRGFLLAAVMAAMMSPDWALAQDQRKSPAEETSSESADAADISLQVIEVRSVVRREELQSTSATVLENKDVVDRIYYAPLDILKLSPGVAFIDQDENGVASSGVTIRGFQGVHGGGNLAFYVDGIPMHDMGHGEGYTDTNLLIPLEIESTEIIKGPASVYYGLHAAGGTAAFQTYKKGDFTRFNLRYGSDNTYDASGILARTDGDMDHVYAFQTYHSDGWRDNMDWNKQNISAHWTYHFTDKFSASLNVRGNNADWDSAGTILSNMSRTSARMDQSGQANGGNRRRGDARIWANYMINDESQLTFYSFFTDLDNTRWELNENNEYWALNGLPDPNDRLHSGRQQYNERRAYGMGLAYNFKGEINDHDLSVTVGADYLHEKETKDEYYLCWGSGRANCQNPQRWNKNTNTFSALNNHGNSQYTDYFYNLNTLSLFGEVNYQLLDPLRVRLGLRYDTLTGDMTTGSNQIKSGYLDANKHFDAKRRSTFSPKAGLIYSPVDQLDLFTSYGRGFTMSRTNNADFFADDRDLGKVDQYEFGLTLRPHEKISLGLLYFLINTTGDEVFNLDKNDWENAGTTQRDGLEASLDIDLMDDLRLHADYSYQTAKYKEFTDARGNDVSGQRLSNSFRHITNAELTYAPVEGLGGRARYYWYADRANGGDYGGLDLQATYRFNEKYKLTLDMTNALDHDFNRNQGAPYASGVYTYSPLRGRSVFLGLDVNWE